MAFLDQRFPDEISYGSSFGPGYSTDIVVAKSGKEFRNQNWQESRYAGDVSLGVQSLTDMQTLLAFFRIAKGRANSFRYKDWGDYSATDSFFATGDGSTRSLQLYKRYTSGTDTDDRKITRPISPITLKRGGSSFTNFTVDYTTGIVTLTSNASDTGTDISATNSDSSFNSTSTDLSVFGVGDIIQVSGFTESDNNGTFKVASSAATKITVTDTDGSAVSLTDEAAGDTVTIEEEPSVPGEDFTWTGEFDVPCRFDTDQISAVYENYDNLSVSVPIVEVLE